MPIFPSNTRGVVTTNKQLTPDQCKALDGMACSVAEEVERVEKISPRAEWSATFYTYVEFLAAVAGFCGRDLTFV